MCEEMNVKYSWFFSVSGQTTGHVENSVGHLGSVYSEVEV